MATHSPPDAPAEPAPPATGGRIFRYSTLSTAHVERLFDSTPALTRKHLLEWAASAAGPSPDCPAFGKPGPTANDTFQGMPLIHRFSTAARPAGADLAPRPTGWSFRALDTLRLCRFAWPAGGIHVTHVPDAPSQETLFGRASRAAQRAGLRAAIGQSLLFEGRAEGATAGRLDTVHIVVVNAPFGGAAAAQEALARLVAVLARVAELDRLSAPGPDQGDEPAAPPGQADPPATHDDDDDDDDDAAYANRLHGALRAEWREYARRAWLAAGPGSQHPSDATLDALLSGVAHALFKLRQEADPALCVLYAVDSTREAGAADPGEAHIVAVFRHTAWIRQNAHLRGLFDSRLYFDAAELEHAARAGLAVRRFEPADATDDGAPVAAASGSGRSPLAFWPTESHPEGTPRPWLRCQRAACPRGLPLARPADEADLSPVAQASRLFLDRSMAEHRDQAAVALERLATEAARAVWKGLLEPNMSHWLDRIPGPGGEHAPAPGDAPSEEDLARQVARVTGAPVPSAGLDAEAFAAAVAAAADHALEVCRQAAGRADFAAGAAPADQVLEWFSDALDRMEARCLTAARGVRHLRDLARCSRCRRVYYCSRECQLQDWTRHKGAECGIPAPRD
ncbi:hypothetical protein H696_05480 [Fonticula alba]|uniref:MYND-type domain-containing protein n=1 Tax=Fonticula alba TaxID=691883 RepID=A0A058Z1M6_FONAL|nr:hypothetical protein H696_05480 [Fonticula alba]KCV68011.1 hypothetical protein H696_05480 [Fonticula alba]|eukprot:XP_009497578.1 hypothetical protein H696_05480 [Fonticula alba]